MASCNEQTSQTKQVPFLLRASSGSVQDFVMSLGGPQALLLDDEMHAVLSERELFRWRLRLCEESVASEYCFPIVKPATEVRGHSASAYVHAQLPEVICKVELVTGEILPHCEFRFLSHSALLDSECHRCIPAQAIADVQPAPDVLPLALTELAQTQCGAVSVRELGYWSSQNLYAKDECGREYLLQNGAYEYSDYFFRCGDVTAGALVVKTADIKDPFSTSHAFVNEIRCEDTYIILADLPHAENESN